MSVPRQLVKSFNIIRDCKLVVTKQPTDDNLKEFGKAINNSIPTETNQISYMIYKFIRGMYLKDKQSFLKYIDGMPLYECMVLWTDYDDILKYFDIHNVIFLGWNKTVNKYQASRIDPDKISAAKAAKANAIAIANAIIPDIPTSTPTPPSPPSFVNAADVVVNNVEQSDDYEKIYNRIKSMQQNTQYH